MICSFNGQDSQPIQPLLSHAAQVGLNQFQFGKESKRIEKTSHVMSETIAGQCTKGRCYGVNFDLFTFPIQ